MESFEHMGYWWCPDDPEPSLFGGKLSFDPETGGVLELMGQFGAASRRNANEFKQFELIHGHNPETGNTFTLHYCYETLIRPSLSGNPYHSISKLSISFIYKCKAIEHFEDSTHLIFDKLEVSYAHLNAWMGEFNWKHGTTEKDKFDVTHIPFSQIRTSYESTDIILHENTSGNYRYVANDVLLKSQYAFTVIPPQALSISQYRDMFLYPLRTFVAMGVGISCPPLAIQATKSKLDLTASVNYRTPGFVEERQDLHSLDMLYSFNDIDDSLPQYLSTWIGVSRKIRTALDLFFLTYHQPDSNTASSFLYLAQALEAYHRDKLDENEDKQKTYFKERILRICNSVLDHHRSLFHLVVWSCKETFAENVRITRNYYAHNSKKEGEEPLIGQALIDYCQIMSLLFELRMLTDMRMPADLVNKLIARSRRYKFVSRSDRWSAPFF